jgi:hypothetical protein
VVYIHSRTTFNHKNEILSFATKWMEPEDIMLSKKIQTQKRQISYFYSYMEDQKNVDQRAQSRIVGS